MSDYLFTSERLGFRNWDMQDLDFLAEMNADKEVMKWFPATQTRDESKKFIERMQISYYANDFCYFATEIKELQQLVGFIGLSVQTFKSDFTPAIDIGWRLARPFWYYGLATEGALRCLEWATNTLQLEKVISIAPVQNVPSIHIMEKIGMKRVKEFMHPKLIKTPHLNPCVLYQI